MRDISCDIAVIGTDYVGLCCGYALRKLGLKVEFVSITDQPSSWLSPWVQLHGRPGKLDWSEILPKQSDSETLGPLQLSSAQSRISLEPHGRHYLAKWLNQQAELGSPKPDQKLLQYFELKSAPPPSRQGPKLTIPASSGFARLLKSQRGGGSSWPSGDRERCSLNLGRYPGKALFSLSGVCETSAPPTFLEDDLESFLFGILERPWAGALEASMSADLRDAIKCEALSLIKLRNSFGTLKGIEVGTTTRLTAQTYLFNVPSTAYSALTGEALSSNVGQTNSNFWRFRIKKSKVRCGPHGRALYADPEESSVCYVSWKSKGADIEVELLTTEDVAYQEVSSFGSDFFGASPEQEHTHQKTGLPTLAQLNQPKVATRFRNALYVGEDLAPRHHLAAQCDIAEELLKAISIYREAPLNLTTLPHLK